LLVTPTAVTAGTTSGAAAAAKSGLDDTPGKLRRKLLEQLEPKDGV
jgi:hypothetical protein